LGHITVAEKRPFWLGPAGGVRRARKDRLNSCEGDRGIRIDLRGWIVPELGIPFGEKLTRLVRSAELRGLSWRYLARMCCAVRAA